MNVECAGVVIDRHINPHTSTHTHTHTHTHKYTHTHTHDKYRNLPAHVCRGLITVYCLGIGKGDAQFVPVHLKYTNCVVCSDCNERDV